jgi:phage head maturation protease
MDKKSVTGELRSFDDERFVCEVVANSGGLDRVNETLQPVETEFGRGCLFETYMRSHPVILFGHDDRTFPVGKALNTWATAEEGVVQEVQFAANVPEHRDARIAWGLVRGGFLKAASVRFQPNKWRDFEPGTPEYATLGTRSYDEWELLETSIVNVPCEPGSGVRAADARPDLVKALAMVSNGSEVTFLVEKMVKEGLIDLEPSSTEDKRVIPYHEYPWADIEMDWSFNASDGDALIEKGGYELFAKVHTFQTHEHDEESKAAYKLPHHKLVNGSVKTVWRGVAAAMARLLSSADIPDDYRKGCYNHLAKHYREIEKPVPEFRNNYTELEARFAALGIDTSTEGELLARVERRFAQELGMHMTTIVADELSRSGLDPEGIGLRSLFASEFAPELRDEPKDPEYLIDEETDKALMRILAPVARARE